MEKIIRLKPIIEDKSYYDEIEKKIIDLFKKEFYYPLLNTFNNKIILNSIDDSINKALLSGKIYYSNNKFHGKFSSSISKQLIKYGAKFDKKDSTYILPLNKLPLSIRSTISISTSKYEDNLKKIDTQLSQIDVNKFVEKLDIASIFEKNMSKVDRTFEESIDYISIVPKIPKKSKEIIAKEWQNNMELYIKNFTEEQIISLRKVVYENVFVKGNRREVLIKKFMENYNVTENKAKFWARQETNLLMAKYKETKYIEAGILEYEWRCVHMPHQLTAKSIYKPGDVRYSHGILEGNIFSWKDPPVTTAPGQPQRRNNPGQDYNCIPEYSNVSFYGAIHKAFRRRYTGELTELITSNGSTIHTTRNHPILTQRGWISAHEINIGDNVFSSHIKSFFTEEMETNNIKSSAQDIFNSLSFISKISSDRLSKSNFHGDVGENEEVDIISMDRELAFKIFINAYQEIFHFIFEGANTSISDFSTSNSFINNLIFSDSSSSLMSIFCEIELFLFTHFSHSKEISFRTRTNDSLGLFQPFSYDTSTNPVIPCYTRFTHPILIILNSIFVEGDSAGKRFSSSIDNYPRFSEFNTQNIWMNADDICNFSDRKVSSFIKNFSIVDKNIRNFSGHVYNFETSTNWFISNDIIVHNCRCFAIPIIRFNK